MAVISSTHNFNGHYKNTTLVVTITLDDIEQKKIVIENISPLLLSQLETNINTLVEMYTEKTKGEENI